jgi:hypothetical protein
MFFLLIFLELFFQASYKTGLFQMTKKEPACTQFKYVNLYHSSDLNRVDFCRDKNGFISSANDQISKSTVYICGGSVTEGYVIPPRNRWPSVLEKELGVRVINDSQSGRTLANCLDRLKEYLESFVPPDLVIFANTVNTLGKFSHDFSLPPVKWNDKFAFYLTKSLRVVMPGFYTARGMGFFNNVFGKDTLLIDNISHHNSDTYIVDTNYAKSLDLGCCHFMSGVNRYPADSRFDWESKTNLDDYKKYYTKNLKQLEQILIKFDLPKDRILFIFEAYSYGLGTSKFGDPLRRQGVFRYSNPGYQYSSKKSAEIVRKFDSQVIHALTQLDYKYLNTKLFLTRPEFFYDSVHLTPMGGSFMGKNVADYVINSYKSIK